VRDLPAALNAAITRADASRTLAVAMRIGLSDRGEPDKAILRCVMWPEPARAALLPGEMLLPAT